MAMIDTEYANTDFDLKSESSFDILNRELSSRCHGLHYTHGDDGHYYACFESDDDGEMSESGAERDILLIVNALNMLSDAAKAELDTCYLREFNIGFHCGDSWAFMHSLPHNAVAAVSDVGCSLAVTLYPMRQPDGTPR